MFKLVVVNQQPQMKEEKTTKKRYVDNNLLQLLVLEMFVRSFRKCSAVAAITD